MFKKCSYGVHVMSEDTQNRIRLDYADNPELQALLGTRMPGESVTVTFDVTVTSNDETGMVAAIDRIHTGEEPEDGTEPIVAEPDSEEPVMAVILPGEGEPPTAEEVT